MGNLINESGCKTIIVNGVEDHVHCFLGLKPTVAVSDLMQTVKAKSSKWVNATEILQDRFEWQEGFGCFSYSRSAIDSVYHYIENQETHHRRKIFKDEYLDLLNEFGVDYDQKYIFRDLI